MRKALWFIFALLLLAGTACSIRVYDLQPLIVPSNTPFAVRETATLPPIVTRIATEKPRVTNTPPIHIAPTKILHVEEINVLKLSMIDGGTGWGVGQLPGQSDKLFIRTTDGGETWHNITPSDAVYANAVGHPEPSFYASDRLNAWLLFWSERDRSPISSITVWRTDDGGETWSSAELPMTGYTSQYFLDPQIGFSGSRIGWILAKLGNNAGREYVGLYTTNDGGASWNVLVSPDSGNLSSAGSKTGAVFINALDGWISSTNTRDEPDALMWRTSDGGNSWSKVHIPVPLDAPADLFSSGAYTCSFSTPKFINDLHQVAWMKLSCYANGTEPIGSFVYWTYDTMNSWRAYRLPQPLGELTFYGIDSYGIDRGWYTVQTENGSYQILYTEDGGNNWRPIANTGWTITAQFIAPSVGFGIATFQNMPYLMRTDNTGYSWTQIPAKVVP